MMRHHFLPDAVAIIGTMDLVFGLVLFRFCASESTAEPHNNREVDR